MVIITAINTVISFRDLSRWSCDHRCLSRSIPWSTDLSPATAVPYPMSTELSSAPVPIPPSTSLLLRPGRALTLADFPEPSASASSDDSSATPYHPRFVPAVRAPPDPPTNFRSPLGIWPSAAVRRRTSTEWYTALLDPQPATVPVHIGDHGVPYLL